MNNLEGLPDALLAQLSRRATGNPLRSIILTAIGDGASINQVLIYIYRLTGAIPSRNSIIGHLFRMKRERLIEPIKRGKRTIGYRLTNPSGK